MADLTEIDAYTTLVVGLVGHTFGQIHSHSTSHNYMWVTFHGEGSSIETVCLNSDLVKQTLSLFHPSVHRGVEEE